MARGLKAKAQKARDLKERGPEGKEPKGKEPKGKRPKGEGLKGNTLPLLWFYRFLNEGAACLLSLARCWSIAELAIQMLQNVWQKFAHTRNCNYSFTASSM